MSDVTRKNNIRWWPVLVIFCFLGITQAAIWFLIDWPQQSVTWLASYMAFAAGLVLVLIWFLFFSRLGVKVRLIGLIALIALIGFLVICVEIREVDGDVLPILAWSWTPHHDETLTNTELMAEDKEIKADDGGHDYPRFLGADLSGVVENIRLAQSWEVKPPLEKWRISLGAAWSGFAVKGNLVLTQEQRGTSEMVTCYELDTGRLIWAHGDETRFETTVGGIGPRATPTIAKGRVYTMGALGLLNCLDLASGKLLWQRNTAEEHGASAPRWGYACSPLVFTHKETGEELVVVSPGGPDGRSLAAYRTKDGGLAWSGGSAPPGYSSPQLASLAGSEMILIFNHGSIAGHNPSDGSVLWESSWPGGKPCVANPRQVEDNRLLVSTGYGIGAKLYEVTKESQAYKVEVIYESTRLKAKFANFVISGDYAYGLDDGVATCVEVATGNRVWKKGRYGHGQLLLAGDILLLQAEDGTLHLIKAQPDELHELGRFPVLNGKSWNPLALAGNRLLLRNHKEAVCLELPLE